MIDVEVVLNLKEILIIFVLLINNVYTAIGLEYRYWEVDRGSLIVFVHIQGANFMWWIQCCLRLYYF